MVPYSSLDEKWSAAERRKRAKRCARPKGFTMKQFCKNQKTRSSSGERKNESAIRSLIRESLLLELRNAPDNPVPSDPKYFARPVAGGYVLYYTVGPDGTPVSTPGTTAEDYDKITGNDYDFTPEQLNRAEELVSLGIHEKIARKTEFKDIDFKYNKKKPGTPAAEWKAEEDVPDTYFVYGKKGAFFEYLLVDTENRLVSLDARWTRRNTRRGGSTPSKDSKKSYVMPSGDVAFVGREVELKKLLKHLTQVDPRVTSEYKIISPDDKYEGKTIGGAAEGPRTADVAVGGVKGTITAYHGTTTARWKDIEKRGMLPGKFSQAYADQVPGYSVKNLYFAMDPQDAENYATRAAIWYGGSPLILKVEIPDITKIVPDEDTFGRFRLNREYTLTRSERHSEETKWDPEKSRWITTKTIKPGEKVPLEQDQYFNNIMRLARIANRSITGSYYDKDISDAPEAGSEWVHDDEYKEMLRDIESKLTASIAKGINRAGTFAYRGWIPPKFIKKWKEYPKKAYPKSVDTGIGGKPTDYEDTRQEVLGQVKRFEESAIRLLVRSMLSESSAAPNFASSVTHSAGWIDPEGRYFYDPNMRDHGEWAAFQAEKDPKLMKTLLEELKKETDPIPPPPPRNPTEQAEYDKKSDMRKRMDDWQRQGGRSLKGKPIPPYNNMSELYYSDIQSEVRSSAQRALLMSGWGKVSNAYGIELWKPSRSVLKTWMDLGMESGSDPERYHNVYNKNGSIVEGDWMVIENFMRRLS